MTGMSLFCVASVLFLVPRDFLSAEAREVEVWLGFEVYGAAARWSAPLHWALFAVGAWAFWTQRPWIVPAAAGYAFYVAFSHLVWNQTSPDGRGWPMGLLQAALLCLPGVLLLYAQRRARLRGTSG
jgi:hypothetical protein